jgi:WD40 repeat protein
VSSVAAAAPEATARLRASPYVGLTYFTEEDALFFFGREPERRIIKANLMASRLTLVYGPSGVGKSSLLRAGVARDLRTTAEQDVEAGRMPESIGVVFSSWRDEPIFALAEAITTRIRDLLGDLAPEPVPPSRDLSELLASWGERLDSHARHLEAESDVRQPQHVELLLVLDQFEEYFVYHPDEEGAGTFAGEFPRAVNKRGLRTNFLVSIREDAYTLLDRFEDDIPNLFGHNIRIEHLDRASAEEAVRAPVRRYNELWPSEAAPSDVEDELVDAVLLQVRTGSVAFGRGGGGLVDVEIADDELRVETPFLQLVMERLWSEEVTAHGSVLRLTTLEKLGGAQAIVHAHLGLAISELDDDARALAASVFARLVTPSGSKIAYLPSDLAALEKVPLERLTALLPPLADARILRTVAPAPGESEPRYEIFHDVLAPAILQWSASFAAEQEQRQAAEEERERSAESRRRLRGRLLTVIALVFLVGAVGATLLAVFAIRQSGDAMRQQHLAEQSARLARSQRITSSALSQLSIDPELAALLAKKAIAIKRTPQAEAALRQALSQPYYVRWVLRTSQKPLRDAAFSRDGKLAATVGDDRLVRIWSVATGRQKAQFPRAGAALKRVAFSPNGRYVAAGASNGCAYVWAVGTRRLTAALPLAAHGKCGGKSKPSDVTAVAFAPDSTRLVAGDAGGAATIWRLPRGSRLASLSKPEGPIYDASFSRDGRRVQTASKTNIANIWDARTGSVLPSRAPARVVRGKERAFFSADRSEIVLASPDGTARVWSRGSTVAVLRGHTGAVTSAEFNATRSFIVTASLDSTARVWRPNGEPVAVLRGHKSAVDAARIGQGGVILTASRDGTARLWQPVHEPVTVLPVDRFISTTVFSPLGSRMAVTVGPVRGPITVWNTATGKNTDLASESSPQNLLHAHFAADNSLLVVNNGRAELRRDGTLVRRLGSAYQATLSGDGKRAALVTRRTVRVIEVSTGHVLGTVRPTMRAGGGLDDLRLSFAGNTMVTFTETEARGSKAEIWRIAPMRKVVTVDAHLSRSSDGEEFSRDGRRLVLIERGSALVLDTHTGLRIARVGRGSVSAARINSDGTLLLTLLFSDPAHVWSATTGKSIASGPSVATTTSHFSPNGELVATGSRGGLTEVWEARTGQPVEAFRGPRGVGRVIFSPNGRDIATAELTVVRIWRCRLCGSLADVMAVARERVHRQLTRQEIAQYVAPR